MLYLKEYIDLINDMEQYPGMYTLDNMRSELHEKIKQDLINTYTNIDPKMIDAILHNIELISGDKISLERHVSSNVVAHKIEKFINDNRNFLTKNCQLKGNKIIQKLRKEL